MTDAWTYLAGAASDQMNSSSKKKSVWALAAILASFVFAFRISQGDVPTTTARAAVGLSLLFGLPFVAIVLAVLGLREVRISRKVSSASRGTDPQTYWSPLVALVLAVSFVGTFGFYLISHYLHRTLESQSVSTAPRWQRFTSLTGDFTVLFPGLPTVSSETVTRPGGPVALHAVVFAMGAGEGYSVLSAEAPKDAGETTTATLDRLEAEFVERSNGKLLARAEVSAGTVVGRDLRVDSAERTMRVRLFANNRHIYQVLVIHHIYRSENGMDTRFLESFTLQGS